MSEHDSAIDRTAHRFAGARRATLHYVRAKLRGDPFGRALASLAPLGEVIDLGCGRGQWAVFILERGAASRVGGYDWDAAKLDVATRAAEGLDARFTRIDLREDIDADADTVILADVLHYFSRDEQDAFLDRAARMVRPGGRLILRDATRGRGVRSLLTLAFERAGTFARVNRGERVVFRDVAREVVPRLEAIGMTCTLEPCWQGTPFANVLVVATRPRTPS